jgi:hypothetical protein
MRRRSPTKRRHALSTGSVPAAGAPPGGVGDAAAAAAGVAAAERPGTGFRRENTSAATSSASEPGAWAIAVSSEPCVSDTPQDWT